ncbi:MAG: helix-turn-helix domain-containing protein [Pyrinomonadaceae bacterium]
MENKSDSARLVSYYEMPPPPHLAHLVFCFFELAFSESKAPTIYNVLPDGCMGILIKFNRNSPSPPIVLVRGLESEIFEAKVECGDKYWGVRLFPAANRLVLGADPGKIATSPLVHLPQLNALRSFLETKLGAISERKDAFKLLSDFFESLEINPDDADRQVTSAITALMKAGGNLSTDDLLSGIPTARRTLERRFRKNVGLGIKQYSRLYRLRATGLSLISDIELSWADRAAMMGFSDQSHLIREFALITNRTPTELAAEIGIHDFGDLETPKD